jgi:hypothetical protein
MRLPRVRFTVRTMMAAVVLFALGLGFCLQVVRTADYYRKVSQEYCSLCMLHEGQARAYERLASQLRAGWRPPVKHYTDWTLIMWEPRVPLTFARRNEPLVGRPRLFDPDPAKDVAVAERFAARALVRASYFDGLRRKYHAASSCPWLPIAPDPPPPD